MFCVVGLSFVVQNKVYFLVIAKHLLSTELCVFPHWGAHTESKFHSHLSLALTLENKCLAISKKCTLVQNARQEQSIRNGKFPYFAKENSNRFLVEMYTVRLRKVYVSF